MNLTIEFRPRRLTEVFGQPAVVKDLRSFVADPYSEVFLFHGETGTGKSAAAYALACELGVKVEEEQLGGLFEIASGEMTADAVRQRMRSLYFKPLFGSGWRVLIANEADRMTNAAEIVWLDVLEHLPPTTVIVFTTNDSESLTDRFRDRCCCHAFTCDPEQLAPAIRALAMKVWKAKKCKGEIPGIDKLGMPTAGDEGNHASFRLALKQLSRYIRAAKSGGDLQAIADDIEKERMGSAGLIYEAACDHCGEKQDIHPGKKSHKCVACGKNFEVHE